MVAARVDRRHPMVGGERGQEGGREKEIAGRAVRKCEVRLGSHRLSTFISPKGTINAPVVLAGISAPANLNVVIEQHLEDLSAIEVRANEPKLPCLLECKLAKSCAAAYRTIINRSFFA